MAKSETYQGGYDALLKRIEGRTSPLEYADGEALPALDEDLTPLRTTATHPSRPKSASSFATKRWRLQTEFEGQPDLLWLHGLVIANLRKDGFPDHTPELFQKLWREHDDFFLRRLPLRWLVSAVVTFGDHGINEAQRQCGRSLSLLFSMMKLYEFERLYTGTSPEEAFSTDYKLGADLPLGIPAYSLKGGGLDASVLGRLWKESGEDPVIEPLAKHLLTAINEDPGTLFRRLRIMSSERVQTLKDNTENPIPVSPGQVKRNPRKIAWGVMATVNENPDQTIAFAAHHLDLGADQVILYGDDPNALPMELAEHPKILLVPVDSKIMSKGQRLKMPNRNARKAYYFNRARRKAKLDWLAMLDTDEFLSPSRPVRRILARTPADAAFLTLNVVEKYAGSPDAYRAPASKWQLSKAKQEELFPVFNPYVTDLMLGPADPRLFLRAKTANVRVGNFVVKYDKRPATNGHTPDELVVAHNHVDDLEGFLEAMHRRLDQGYARRGSRQIDIRATLETLDLSEDSPELRNFFTEVACARPEVLSALEDSGDLHRIDLKLKEKVQRFIEEIAQ